MLHLRATRKHEGVHIFTVCSTIADKLVWPGSTMQRAVCMRLGASVADLQCIAALVSALTNDATLDRDIVYAPTCSL